MIIEFNANGNEKQLQACQIWHDTQTDLILYGGAKYTGKSYLGSSLILIDALTYPETHYFIARNNLNDLRKYTKPSLYECMDHFGLASERYMTYNGQDNFFSLYNGSKIFFIDASYKPSDSDWHRFGSIQMTRGWLEEIGEMHPGAIEALILTVGRWNNHLYPDKDGNPLRKKVLMTCNPHKGYGYREFYLPNKNGILESTKKFIQALPQDNKIGDQDYINSIVNHKIKAIRERLGRGSWEYDDSPDVLVDYDKILEAWTNEDVPGGLMAITADIAFMGSDKFVITVWNGWRIVHIHVMDKSTPKEVETMIKLMAEKFGVQRSRVVFDADGIGAYLESYLKHARPFKNGSKPIGRDNFANLKAQCGYGLAKRFNRREIFFEVDTHKDEIITDIEQLKSYMTDKEGKLQLLPKAKIKELIGRSPDFLDTLIMREFLEVNHSSMRSSIPGSS